MSLEVLTSWRTLLGELGELGHALCSAIEGDDVLGAIALRHRLNAKLLDAGGHIGYGVRPSARGRGLATWALGRVVRTAAAMGLDRVLLTCTVDNPASARVIEHAGGVLEDVRDTWLGRSRRYWITLS